MRHLSWLLLVVVLLSACGGAPAESTGESAVIPTQPATAFPSSVPPTDVRPTTAPTAEQLAPTSAPTATTAPTEAPTTTPEPSATPVPPTALPEREAAAVAYALPGATLDVAAQAGAMTPDFQGDLDQAGAWNRYTISGAIDPLQRTLQASQRVEYTNRDTVALDRLYFHLYPNLTYFGGDLRVTTLAVDGQPIKPVYEAARYLLRVNLPQPLAPNATVTVTLDFTTRTPQNASSSRYGAFNKENGVLALASAYPLAAVVRDGVWDIERPDPRGDFVNSETSLYDVTLKAPADWKLVTTGSAIEYQAANGSQTVRFVSGPQRDFTITAVQLNQVSAEVDGTTITSYFRAGSAAGGQGALDAAANAVRAFNKRYGRYPFRELDVVEIDARQFLGVEYPGLTMIEHALYNRPSTLELTVAHEVGHMWFYGIIGNNVQRESWLDEAFASYSEVIYQEEVRGLAAAELALNEFRNRYRTNLQAGRDAPVAQPNRNFRRNYVQLVYGKAVLFLQVLRERLGEEGFDRFLKEYYSRHRYGYVSGGNLLASAEGVCGCELDQVYEDWILKAVPVEVP